MSSMSRDVFHRKIFSEPFSWKCFGIIFLVRVQNFPKKKNFLLLIRKRTRACQGVRNVNFWENLTYVVSG